MRYVQFVNEGYYHVYNRGVDKRTIFVDRADYERFIKGLAEFRDPYHIPHVERGTLDEFLDTPIENPLVRIVAFSLMPNHYHLLLCQNQEGGISNFMHRLGTGYTKYFNKRYNRKGRFFQQSFCAIPVLSDDYLLHLTRYININPLDLHQPAWQEEGIRNPQAAWQFLNDFPWSSYMSYLGESRYRNLIDNKLPLSIVGSADKYRDFVQSWTLKDARRYLELKNLFR